MSLPELTTPIRIYWDLTPLPEPPPDHEKIAADIISLRILSIDITAVGAIIPEVCFNILHRLAEGRIAVTLTVSPEALNETAAAALETSPPKEILLQIGSLEELRAQLPCTAAVSGVSFPLTDANWQEIPEVIACCAASSLYHLILPMQRLYRGEKPFHLPAAGLQQLAAQLSAAPPDPAMRITVHDPFVWRAIFPQTPFPEGRCQAANTMLAIDSSGTVYPCPVMPVALGDLQHDSLRNIARGEAKTTLRARLLRLPADCIGCAEAEGCQGGCRGRGERLTGSWNVIDPGCR